MKLFIDIRIKDNIMTKFKYHKDGSKPTEDNQIFVFGSNLSGIHGAGAAREAYENYGAKWGKAFGFSGKTFAIPTKDRTVSNTLNLNEIRTFINIFILETFLEENIEKEFFITRVGCGLAGLKDSEVAHIFKDCNVNCNFPEEWTEYLE